MHASPSIRFAVVTVAVAMAACGTTRDTSPPATDTGCTSCHGDAARAADQAAPPRDAHGQTDTSLVTVGAHQAHLSSGVACATCHVVPPDGDLTHIGGPYATVTFSGSLVGANNTAVAAWNRDLATCTNYCHGASLPGAARPAPLWTQATPLGCGGCHADQRTKATSTGLHELHLQFVTPKAVCSNCHGAGYTDTAVAAPATATHRDGQVNTLSLVGWQDPRCVAEGPRACFASCHQAVVACKIWP
jgi:predicted CxxxxCH...CXXCH cytochrome family protein